MAKVWVILCYQSSARMLTWLQSAIKKPSRIIVVSLFKRKKELSVEEFRNYYENNHVRLFDKFLELPGVERYVRRYLTPMEGLLSGGPAVDSGYDVIMEIWFTDQQVFESFCGGGQDPVFRDIVIADEEKFLDRESMSINIIEEFDSKEPPC